MLYSKEDKIWVEAMWKSKTLFARTTKFAPYIIGLALLIHTGEKLGWY